MCLAEAQRAIERGVREKRVENMEQSKRDCEGKNVWRGQSEILMAECMVCRGQDIARTPVSVIHYYRTKPASSHYTRINQTTSHHVTPHHIAEMKNVHTC